MLKSEKLNARKLFVLLSAIGIVSFFLIAVFFGSRAFDWLCMRNTGTLRFVDYFIHVLFSSYPDQLYEVAGWWGTFPPLAYCFYRLMYLLTAIPGVYPESVTDLLNNEYALTVFVLYSILVASLMLYAVGLWGKSGKKGVFLCLLMSAPVFAGGIERGNSVLVVFALILIALKWRESETKWKRELALILIAAAAGLKIYPAVLGLLYLKERRYREALRLIVYGVVLFFLPFAFFGGVAGFQQWLANVQLSFVESCVGRIECIKGIFSTLSYCIAGTVNETAASVLPIVFLFLMLALAIVSKNKYRVIFFLCAIMVFFPDNMHRYALTILAVPLVMYLMERGEEPFGDVFQLLEIVAFAFLFSIPTVWGILTRFRLQFALSDYMTYVEVWLYAMAYLLVILVSVHELAERRKLKKGTPAAVEADGTEG